MSQELPRSIALAYLAHSHQSRKGSGVPYIIHPQQVAELLSEYPKHVQAAAWLHDVLEDTNYKYEDIVSAAGGRVADIVKEVTELKLDEHGNKRPWRVRKEEAIAVVPKLSEEAKTIRAADVLSNFMTVIEDLDTIGDGVWQRFNAGRDESLWYYEQMMTVLIQNLKTGTLKTQLKIALRVVHAMRKT